MFLNIVICVQDKERRLAGFKSHDAHIMLHYLPLIAIKNPLPKNDAIALIKLEFFFRGIYVVKLLACAN